MARDDCCQGEDWCAVTCTAAILGNKWHPILVHRLIENGPLTYGALHASVAGLSSKELSASLDRLGQSGILMRDEAEDGRPTYHLTPAGADLGPVITAMEAWGRQHQVPTTTLRV